MTDLVLSDLLIDDLLIDNPPLANLSRADPLFAHQSWAINRSSQGVNVE